MPTPSVSSRILAFDYLRGFFILVILIDHLWLWPNFFSVLSGEGRLWVTAAEGFVIISGLLVGYIRGYKNRYEAWATVAGKLLRRAGVLYVWSIITALVFTTIYWCYFQSGVHGSMPYVQMAAGDWYGLVRQALTLEYAHVWTYFLHLYAIFLVLSVPVVVLLRKSLWWLVILISIGLWGLGYWLQVDWLVWQCLFFLPATVGFHLEAIRRFFATQQPAVRQAIKASFIYIAVLTAAVSALIAFYDETLRALLGFAGPAYTQFSDFANKYVSHEASGPVWLLLSFIWFGAFFIAFQAALPWLQRWFGWLLEPFGTRSLTAYILHGVPMTIILYFFAASTNTWLNSLLTLAAILATWGLLQLRWLRSVIPR